jgi:beta-1,4-glucosyltransferase
MTSTTSQALGRSLTLSRFPVTSTTRERLADYLLQRLGNGEKTAVFFANTNFIVKCRFLQPQLPDPSIVLVNDGVGMDIAAKIFAQGKFEENLNGTDFTPYLFQNARRSLKVFMIGSTPEVLARAAIHVETVLDQQVVGTCDGFAGIKDSAALLARIETTKPDVVLVAMGNPMQEQWIMTHRTQIDAGICIGVGALFDFWSGGKARAPELVRKLRMEWFYRLCLEPKRLLRRYTLDIGVFLLQCFKYR